MVKFVGVVVLGLCWLALSRALNNGLALTPPMGWMSWERFRCVVDCETRPDECLSEKLIKEQADRMVEDGYLAAGYQYLIIDDCWLAKERDANGKLLPDAERFPSGIKNLSDYIHSKGLKFGLYEDYGTKTCAGYPGSLGHLKEDAELFAEWGVDYTKIDGCYADPFDMDEGYIELGKHFLNTKRPIVYSCSWPYYQQYQGKSPNYTLIAEHCNLWRNFDDIEDSWASVKSIVRHYGDMQEVFGRFSGPGHWNDPDMLIIGNYGLSFDQAKAQMSIWAVLGAPLIMSHDMRHVRPEFKEILLNKGAIKINQDPLGIQGKRIFRNKGIQVWKRHLQPKFQDNNLYAIALFSEREDGAPLVVSLPLKKLGLDDTLSYKFVEVFEAVKPFEVPSNSTFKVKIPPSSGMLFKVSVKSKVDENTTEEMKIVLSES